MTAEKLEFLLFMQTCFVAITACMNGYLWHSRNRTQENLNYALGKLIELERENV